ncbi:MAG: hypothetical protein WC222_02700 [Parachlamydiales bacterium]|jgi:hypothetical protein
MSASFDNTPSFDSTSIGSSSYVPATISSSSSSSSSPISTSPVADVANRTIPQNDNEPKVKKSFLAQVLNHDGYFAAAALVSAYFNPIAFLVGTAAGVILVKTHDKFSEKVLKVLCNVALPKNRALEAGLSIFTGVMSKYVIPNFTAINPYASTAANFAGKLFTGLAGFSFGMVLATRATAAFLNLKSTSPI